jgi:hypothetical protein
MGRGGRNGWMDEGGGRREEEGEGKGGRSKRENRRAEDSENLKTDGKYV